ncbi:MAG: hypothetical protein GXP55_25685 [Deltaproteobacteria bacterium]|nr:hypothetical protein [Deltaproteobacteria bacterium]
MLVRIDFVPRLLALVVLVLAGVSTARATPDAFEAAPGSLDSFHAALVEARAGRGLARVSVYGASHTADDSYTSVLRRLLQARYGDGGPGWVMPASPFLFYDHAGVEFGGRGFAGFFVRGRQRRRAIYGLAGFALNASDGAHARVRTERVLPRVSIHYLSQPGGGRVRMRLDGQQDWVVDTDAALAVRHAEREVELRELRLRVEGGPVRLFGVVLERSAGVVVDNFGVPGARVWDQEPWRLDALRAEADERPADLLILAYGTNESANARVALADVERRGRRALRRLRALSPRASCLLVGPGDWPRRSRRGALVPRPRLLGVRRVQRELARQEGCAFFDTYAFMGGEGSMERWMARGLALDDHVHFTRAGARRLGRALVRALAPLEDE